MSWTNDALNNWVQNVNDVLKCNKASLQYVNKVS